MDFAIEKKNTNIHTIFKWHNNKCLFSSYNHWNILTQLTINTVVLNVTKFIRHKNRNIPTYTVTLWIDTDATR